jgi:hypothetical protein
MKTIPVIVETDEDIQEGTLGVLTPGSGGTRVRDLEVNRLRESLSQLSESFTVIFQDLKQVGGFRLKEVQLQAEITAEGGFALIGTAKAGVKGAITLTFKESSE